MELSGFSRRIFRSVYWQYAAKGLYEERVPEVPPEIIKRHFLRNGRRCVARQGEAASSSIITLTFDLMDDRFPSTHHWI